MKRAGVKLDLENDSAKIFGKEVALNFTLSGHYCIPIDRAEQIPVEKVFSINFEGMGREDRYKILIKLHRQFAHPPLKKLKSLLQDAYLWKDDYTDMLEDIVRKCDLCKRYSKTPPRPVVGMPMATQFNEKVAMDLKQWNEQWILHIIDMWSRFTISVFINRKRSSEVINALMQKWVGIFGVMGSIMTDNGGEFCSDETHEVMSILNVRVITTAAESPFQNGLCERVHAVTDRMLLKLQKENEKTDRQTLLSWANMTRNTLQMWNGFSSHQLIFGKNPSLPGIMTDGLHAFEGSTSSETFAQHLNALHDARKAYIQTETDERIRRALRGKVRAAEETYVNGDAVYYKQEGKERWFGPATVNFQDGRVVFVRHGGIFVRVSPNRLRQISVKFGENRKNSENELNSTIKEEVISEELLVSEVVPAPKEGTENNEIAREPVNEAGELRGIRSETDMREQRGAEPNTDMQSGRVRTVKINDDIRYKLDGQWITGTILSRAGKATGKYKSWYNVRNENNEERSVDLSRLEWVKIPETEINITQTVSVNKSSRSKSIENAKDIELEKLIQFQTYEEVANKGQKTLSTRWVITEKNGQTKAR